ncbi:hypothetical protein DFQ26_004430 [Actinomortierella ambigua]|nr:hypothetical protein DFQ26_004430 [Actinomortierella ambigua]
MRHLTDHPDLLILIAARLDNRALLSCVQVSKAWASHFVPLLWRTYRLRHRTFRMKLVKDDVWQCFTDTNPVHDKLRESAKEAFAKNGHWIRELMVENPGGVRFLASHCSNLTKLICRFRNHDDIYFQEHKEEIVSQVWGMVVRSPKLHTLRLGASKQAHFHEFSWPFYPEDKETTAQQLLFLQNLPALRHLSVAMDDEDYVEFCERFPRLLEARFILQSRRPILHPYKTTGGGIVKDGDGNSKDDQTTRQDAEAVQQRSLKRLVLDVRDNQFDAQMFQCVLRRFPCLERLEFNSLSRLNHVSVDLSTDPYAWWPYSDRAHDEHEVMQDGPSLAIGDSHNHDDAAAELISVLPVPLKQLDWSFLGERSIQTLVAHSSETLEVVTGGESIDAAHDNDPPGMVGMSVTVGRLLARCPKLTWVDCSRLKVDIQYLMDHPWVCCDNLEVLRCTIVGIPKMSADEEALLEVMSRRQKQRQKQRQNHGMWTEEEQRVLEKRDLINRYLQALQDQLAKCPKLRHNFHHLWEKKKSKVSSTLGCLSQ